MMLRLHPLDAVIYRTWLRLMLGIHSSGAAMRDADELFRRKPDPILRVARTLGSALLPRIWGSEARVLYRGLRLEDPTLHGRTLPSHPMYEAMPALSFSESAEVAAYFADSGPFGMPAAPLPNTVTGQLGLPDHGYIATASVSADDVLFHWKYALAIPWLTSATPDDLETIVYQREVVVRAHEGLRLELEAFAAAAASYIRERYPAGEWIPPLSLAH